ncbi:META domain-containing protein [Psychroflexus tropicus]|uniref:META domain-containing protein n=1 Tax=Psychroflexus tropicus TaxID=197345 RepID=UPI000380CDDE|nr:META domain-containing protein [Psychroflexus tropicus]
MKINSKLYLSLTVLSLVLLLGSCKAQKQGKMISDQLMSQDYIVTHLGDQDVSESGLTLKVNPDNSTISGNSGCNNYNFSYKLDGKTLDLGFASATKMYCEETMKLENLFFQKAASVTQFENSKQAINFLNKEGEIVIKAKKQE